MIQVYWDQFNKICETVISLESSFVVRYRLSLRTPIVFNLFPLQIKEWKENARKTTDKQYTRHSPESREIPVSFLFPRFSRLRGQEKKRGQ